MFVTTLLLLAPLGLLASPSAAQDALPRTALPKDPLGSTLRTPLPGLRPEDLEHRLVVKFVDGALARAQAGGGLRSLAGADLAEVRALAARLGVRFEPLVRLPEPRLEALQSRAEQRSGRAQPDIAGMLIARLPETAPQDLRDVAAAFRTLALVEFAYVQVLGAPPPGDIAPPTPDLTANQVHLGPDPGLNTAVLAAHGLTGAGVRLSDCEYGWVATHEDLNDIDTHPEPGQTIHPSVVSNAWDEHGTAVLGETSAVVNAYGCDGVVPGAEVYTFPEWTLEQGFRRVTAITNAIVGSSAGDVVLLEMQDGNGAPAEVDPAVWVVVKVGTDAGVVVVGAAGNGNENLDSAAYAGYMALGDSGAILVGAGTASAAHAKLSFSSYGSRVNLQGWGQNVFSLGYGDFAQYGGDKNQRYTAFFSGTSSASPFVASICVALQEHAWTSYGAPLAPQALRGLLEQTGIPQTGTGGWIGPFPDVAAALAALACPGVTSTCTSTPNSSGAPGVISAGGSASVVANNLVLRAASLPASVPALFFYGAGSTQLPFGNGWMCAGGSPVFRLPPSITSAPDGTLSRAFDLTQPPASSGPGAITPGSTWTFQCWFRDPAAGGAGYDTTDALSVTFCP